MKNILFAAVFLACTETALSQSFFIILPIGTGKGLVPEHGFLPGKPFKTYPTLEKYDFGGLPLRVELFDWRDSLKLRKIDCSTVDINNQSEFRGIHGAQAVEQYIQTLFPNAGIALDSAATDTLRLYLEALDARLIGFGSITAHGLCLMSFRFGNFQKTYCRDITDKDPHSPISRNALVTRKTGTRVILSASIREVMEMFFRDFQAYRSSAGKENGQ